jgi:phosphatidylglycerol:prolipoprotein diacylglycerol transferase
MRRILLVVPGVDLRIHSFGFMMLLACAGAFLLALKRARREGIDPNVIHGLVPWLFLGGLIGARGMFLAMHPSAIQGIGDLLRVWQGGIIFYGCILGGLIGSCIYWSRTRFPFLATADAVAPSLALGIALGRVGCFLNGCCFGAPCDLPWAVRFPAESLPWLQHVQTGLIASDSAYSAPVHPKQLYAALYGLGLLVLLVMYFPKRKRDGEVMALLMVTYPITRFLLEFHRGDLDGLYGGLTISQYISIGLFAAGVCAWFWLARRPRKRYVDESPLLSSGGATAQPTLRGPIRTNAVGRSATRH